MGTPRTGTRDRERAPKWKRIQRREAKGLQYERDLLVRLDAYLLKKHGHPGKWDVPCPVGGRWFWCLVNAALDGDTVAARMCCDVMHQIPPTIALWYTLAQDLRV